MRSLRPARAQVALDLEIEEHRAAHAALGGGHAEGRGDLDPLEQDRIGQPDAVGHGLLPGRAQGRG